MKKALVIIDMQRDFVDGSLANLMAAAIVQPIVSYAKTYDGDLFATCDTHEQNYLETAEGQRLPVVHCVHGTLGWEIVPPILEVLKTRNAHIINKPTFGYLDWDCLQGYDEIELVGTCTDICVVSNALILKAKFPNTNIKVNASLCAGTTAENHAAALAVMQCCQIDVMNS